MIEKGKRDMRGKARKEREEACWRKEGERKRDVREGGRNREIRGDK